MHDSVRNIFIGFSTKFEGRVSHMYLDSKGLVTIGVGYLIDESNENQHAEGPPGEALALPFVFVDSPDQPATQTDIDQEWRAVKAFQPQATVTPQNPQGLSHQFFKPPRTRLKLTSEAIDSTTLLKLSRFEQRLKTHTPEFASFDSWPADAQLGLLSMAWAMGAGFAEGGEWPNFRAAVKAGNWDAAADESKINEQGSNASLRQRNRANRILFTNAARVADGTAPSTDVAFLHYPIVLTPGIPPEDQGGPSGGTSSPTTWPVLREGTIGPLVGALQFLLQEHGFSIDVDDRFENPVTQAVQAFQEQRGLSVDGVVGENTWKALAVTRQLGDQGAAVSALHDRLFLWDIGLQFPQPGIFDDFTDSVVRAFQATKSLGIDGVVGENTWRALLNA